MTINTNGWEQYKKLVVHELERTNRRLLDIDKRLNHIERKLAILDTKVYASAFLASLILTGVFSVIIDMIQGGT
jgi:hypothetical protein|tara:strand:- start:673 stop:894 length:222 start_codon:yes stop_codon:yes gene_type:complete